MHTNQQLRDELVKQAEAAYLVTCDQIDSLFSYIEFYLQRYHEHTIGDILRTTDLYETVGMMVNIQEKVAEEVSEWKRGIPRTLFHAQAFEHDVLIEMGANAQAVLYMLTSKDIDLHAFHSEQFTAALGILIRCNRVLT